MYNTTVHEFGHVAGLLHEQERAENVNNRLCNEGDGPMAIEDAEYYHLNPIPVGKFDPVSIMNYCHPDSFKSKFSLSPGDIKTLKTLYPSKSSAPKLTLTDSEDIPLETIDSKNLAE